MGYTGGTKKNPTYTDLGDHSETIQIDYDPTKISYEDLLDVFWNSHSPTIRNVATQYKSAVFYHNEKQKRSATESRDRIAVKLKREIQTEILPFTGFVWAEAYHQKYLLRRHDNFMTEFKAMYPETKDFVNSTAAARVNGYLGGYGTRSQLQTELQRLGLSSSAEAKLFRKVR